MHISAHWPLCSSFTTNACNSCLFSLRHQGATQRFKGGYIKEMVMTTTCSFAWVWHVRPWGETHFCQCVCIGGKTCFILKDILYFDFPCKALELCLFTFDFHFKDFFITGMVVKLITLSDFDLYSYVLITTMIRWLRWSCMILDWIIHTYKDSPRNFKLQWFMDQSLSNVEKAGSGAGMASVISASPLYIAIYQSICSNV